VSGDRSKAALDALRLSASGGLTAGDLASALDVDVKNVRTILYRARARGECSYTGERWYATGWSPGVAPDGLLPVVEARAEASATGDDEVWTDPLHRLS
jgi:hypothetical protein